MKKQQEFDESQLKNNPFAQTLQIPVTEIIRSDMLNVNADGTTYNGVMYSEKMPKVEIYYCPDCGSNVAGLSDKAQRLFLHILYTLKHKKDYIRINAAYYMNRNNVKSYTTFSNAVKELIRYEFIVATHFKGIYWLNPLRFFPGSRLSKYPQKKLIKQTWDKTAA